MVDQDKIILMSKAALYEKKYMKREHRITDYFVEDYIGINNFMTRVGISLITIFFIILGAFQTVCHDIIIPASIEEFMDVYVKAYIGPWLITMIVYTFISSIVFGLRYKKANKRLIEYKRLIKKLKKYENKEGATDEI